MIRCEYGVKPALDSLQSVVHPGNFSLARCTTTYTLRPATCHLTALAWATFDSAAVMANAHFPRVSNTFSLAYGTLQRAASADFQSTTRSEVQEAIIHTAYVFCRDASADEAREYDPDIYVLALLAQNGKESFMEAYTRVQEHGKLPVARNVFDQCNFSLTYSILQSIYSWAVSPSARAIQEVAAFANALISMDDEPSAVLSRGLVSKQVAEGKEAASTRFREREHKWKHELHPHFQEVSEAPTETLPLAGTQHDCAPPREAWALTLKTNDNPGPGHYSNPVATGPSSKDSVFVMRLSSNLQLPGLVIFDRRRQLLEMTISPNECERFKIDVISFKFEPGFCARVMQGFRVEHKTLPEEVTEDSPFLLHITCDFKERTQRVFNHFNSNKVVLLDRSAELHPDDFSMEHALAPMAEGEQSVPNRSPPFSESLNHERKGWQQELANAKRLEILVILYGRMEKHQIDVFRWSYWLRNHSLLNEPRSFALYWRHYASGPPVGGLLNTMWAHYAQEGKFSAKYLPPVLAPHYKTKGLAGGQLEPRILDFSANYAVSGLPILSSVEDLALLHGLALLREHGYECVQQSRTSTHWFEATCSWDQPGNGSQRDLPQRFVINVATGDLLDSSRLQGYEDYVEVKFKNSKARKVSAMILQETHPDDPVLRLEFTRKELNPNGYLNSLGTLPMRHGAQPCEVQLGFRGRGSPIVKQYEALLWLVARELPEDENFSPLRWILRRGREVAAFKGSLWENFQRQYRHLLPSTDFADREKAASQCLPYLNIEQAEAHRAHLHAMMENFLVVRGPVGTGKTKVLAYLMWTAFCMKSRCVGTAKTNNAVDHLCEEYERVVGQMMSDLGSTCSLPPPMIARANTKGKECAVRDACLRGEPEQQMPRWKRRTLAFVAYKRAMGCGANDTGTFADYRRAILELRAADSKYQSEREHWWPTFEAKSKLDESLKEHQAAYRMTANAAEMEIANTCDCLFTTTATLARLSKPDDDGNAARFRGAASVYLDEVAQLTWTELLLAFAWNSLIVRFIVAGDPCQNGPFIITRAAELNECGGVHGCSLFKHPHLYLLPEQSVQLRQNYRNEPLCLKLLNCIIYGEGFLYKPDGSATHHILAELNAHRSQFMLPQLREHDFVAKPVIWLHTAGRPDAPEPDHSTPFVWPCTDARQPAATFFIKNRPGSVNRHTRHMAADVVDDLVRTGAAEHRQITILSYYRRDAEMVVSEIRAREASARERAQINIVAVDSCTKVYTVDKYQGDENDIVITIFPSFQEEALAYCGKAERLNVAASRARGLLVFIGDVTELDNACKLERAHALRSLMGFLSSHDLIMMPTAGGPHSHDVAQDQSMRYLMMQSAANEGEEMMY